MEWEIKDLLRRRTDLSTFVIHWTRQGSDGKTALENLGSILQQRTLLARTPMGVATGPSGPLQKAVDARKLTEKEHKNALDSQRVVCFTEAPLEQAWSFVCTISGRQNQLEPFGLAFTKSKARRLGVNPVWYVDMTPARGHYWLTNRVGELVEQAAREGSFASKPIASIAPFVEGMGTWREGSRKEFWWEREWRHRGNLQFSLEDIAVVFCPEEHRRELASHVKCDSSRTLPIIDPAWGLEEMIAALAGVSEPG